MRNLLIRIMFDGAVFHGWQIQKNAVTVQEVFQNALLAVTGLREEIKACSRTDTGVHAREFCISLKTQSRIEPQRLAAALNHHLPGEIAVLGCDEVGMDFHARYSCEGKEYSYEIWNDTVKNPFLAGRALHYWYDINEGLLNEAAALYVGRHDFTSMCTLDRRETGDFRRTVMYARVERDKSLVRFIVAADGFLYNMVRIMMGTLLRVQQGKIAAKDISGILERRDRRYAGPTAPAHGLYLNKVFYKSEDLSHE